jgi:UDP-N-acetylmuramoyl-L-alanyl-D-glutamate--2,6-diaminopimelate ligase
MKLKELLNHIYAVQVTGNLPETEISGIEYDSRQVSKDALFVALKGYRLDGHRFIMDAINRGAAAVILEDDTIVPGEYYGLNNVLKILVKDSRQALAEVSNYFFGEPSKQLKLFGITGTNGKTTTAYYIKSILETAGFKTGLTGTIANYIGAEKIESTLTTPESIDLNKLFVQMINAGCSHGVMEVSSHSLALKRVAEINFDSAIFTNITPDHLDFHVSFENYLISKKILFDSLPENAYAIYNSDDIHSVDVLKDCKSKKLSYGAAQDSDFRISNINYDLNGTVFDVKFQNQNYQVNTTLVGNFNAYNACAAFAAALSAGIDSETILSGIKNTPQVPGRFEVFGNGRRKIIVDYSHTPDSLEKALLVLKQITKDEVPIYTVFGCGGNRDKQKRPVMGKIATELSNKVFITSDNPREEDPMNIIEDIKSGIEKNNYQVIENRQDAIREAIEDAAAAKFVVLIAGKGHEDYQEIKGIRTHFSDREVAEKFLKH